MKNYKPKPIMLVAYIDAEDDEAKFLDPWTVTKKVQEILNNQLTEFTILDPSSNKVRKVNCIVNVEIMEE